VKVDLKRFKYEGGGVDSSGSLQVPVTGCCDEPLGFIKGSRFLIWPNDCLLLKKTLCYM
jgi:hypothetical protein